MSPVRHSPSISFVAVLAALVSLPACSKKGGGTGPTTTPVPEAFDSGDLGTSGPTSLFIRQFNTAGSFAYRCRHHGDQGMTGTVNVMLGGADTITVSVSSNTFGTPVPNSPVRPGGYVKWVNTLGTHTVTRP